MQATAQHGVTGSANASLTGPGMVAQAGSGVAGSLSATIALPSMAASGEHARAVGLSSSTVNPTLQARGGHTVGRIVGATAPPQLVAAGIRTPPPIIGPIVSTIAAPSMQASGSQGDETAERTVYPSILLVRPQAGSLVLGRGQIALLTLAQPVSAGLSHGPAMTPTITQDRAIISIIRILGAE
jgi:hypothetical protein